MGLALGQHEASHQFTARLVGVRRSADECDDFVEVVECDLETFEDVGTRLCLGEVVDRATDHHFLTEGQEVIHALLDRQCFRATVYKGEQVHAEGRLKRRHLEQLVEDHVTVCVASQLNNNSHAFTV